MYSNLFFILALTLLSFNGISNARRKKLKDYYNNKFKPFKNSQGCPKVKIDVDRYPYLEPDYSVYDKYFDKYIPDFYRRLENATSKESKKFIKSLNLLSEKTLKKSKLRKKIKKTLTNYLNREVFGMYSKHGDYYYFFHNTGLQEHDVLKRVKKIGDTPETFFDVNTLSKEGLISIDDYQFSQDGSIMAYALMENGSDWVTIKFKNADGTDLPDVLENVKFSSMEFIFNNKGFLYGTYRERKDVDEDHVIYYHKMGTSQKNDFILIEDKVTSDSSISVEVSDDNRYLFVYYSEGEYSRLSYYNLSKLKGKEFTKKINPVPIFAKADADYTVLDNEGDTIYVYTNKNASNGKVFKMSLKDISKGEKKWQIIVKEEDNTIIDHVLIVGSKYMIINRLKDVISHLYVHDKKSGKLIQELKLPKGVVASISGRNDTNEFFITFTNQATPSIIYKGNLDDLNLKRPFKFKKIAQNVPNGFNGDDLKVTQVFYTSTGGVKVPMFMLHKKSLKLNSNNPVYIEVYGGFGVVNSPYFSEYKYLFVRNFNGIYCIANIRGGGEYGDKWHRAGSKHNRQNTIDDIIYGAKYLIRNNYTRPSKLSISGASNGGFVVTVASQQRPDLFGAVISRVATYDMLRAPKFTIGRSWIPEDGDVTIKEDFEYLLKLSPLHTIKRPKRFGQWPSTLIGSDINDDRVHVSHTLKYAASLYRFFKTKLRYQKNPVIVQISKGSGHGTGASLSKAIKEISDEFAFLHLTLNLKWHRS
uniref:Prolyl endopeptidase n=1 Tax=Parastrongyloides trichosuri TaxID=131310 RepID=A0A0N4ZI20_PARTI